MGNKEIEDIEILQKISEYLGNCLKNDVIYTNKENKRISAEEYFRNNNQLLN